MHYIFLKIWKGTKIILGKRNNLEKSGRKQNNMKKRCSKERTVSKLEEGKTLDKGDDTFPNSAINLEN